MMKKTTVLLLFYLLSGYGDAEDKSVELRCMLSCAKSDCASEDPTKFLWCMTKCGRVLSYMDLRTCVQAFFENATTNSSTCTKRLDAVSGGHAKSLSVFCDVLKELFIKKRFDAYAVRKDLYMRALQEVSDMRQLMEEIATLA